MLIVDLHMLIFPPSLFCFVLFFGGSSVLFRMEWGGSHCYGVFPFLPRYLSFEREREGIFLFPQTRYPEPTHFARARLLLRRQERKDFFLLKLGWVEHSYGVLV